MRRPRLGIFVLLLCACTHRQPRQPLAVEGTTSDIDALIRGALVLDAAGDRQADTLYAPEAVVFSNARQRFASPRYAGVSYGGRITIAALAVNLMGSWAWAVVDYRWIGSQRNAEVGRATFVLARKQPGWRIVHAHSSQMLPWDR
jgi:ketosteroid isomerase-like protein